MHGNVKFSALLSWRTQPQQPISNSNQATIRSTLPSVDMLRLKAYPVNQNM